MCLEISTRTDKLLWRLSRWTESWDSNTPSVWKGLSPPAAHGDFSAPRRSEVRVPALVRATTRCPEKPEGRSPPGPGLPSLQCWGAGYGQPLSLQPLALCPPSCVRALSSALFWASMWTEGGLMFFLIVYLLYDWKNYILYLTRYIFTPSRGYSL